MSRLTYRDPQTGKVYLYSNDADVIGRLADLEDLEEQGLLLRLPCKLDIDVFVIPTKENSFNQIACMKFLGIQWDTLGAVMNLFSNNRFDKNVPKMYQPSISKFGKTVFLTEQEAEAALEKMKEGENEQE